nr:reverse transcriptase domain-containing protein [Tanacetum cinerariifolium]
AGADMPYLLSWMRRIARIWLEKEPPQSIFTWDDLVSKFINQFFPSSKITNLRNEITNFQQRFDKSFNEAWDRFKDLLRACPHHGIIDSKSKVRYSRNKPVVAKEGERVNGLVEVEGVEDLGKESVGNVIVNGNRVGCSYKEFLACNPKKYDEFCPSHEMQKLEYELWNYAMVGAGHAAYTDRFHELARLVPHLVTPESRMIKRSVKKVEKRGNVGGPSKDRNEKDDNKRTRTVNAFATTVNPAGRENTWHEARKKIIQIKLLQITRVKVVETKRNQARGRAFMLGAEEDRQDPNIMTGIEPSDLGFKYEIEIASEQLVEINKVIKGCKLEIEGHVFDIDSIPFGHRNFDVIIGERPEEKVRFFMGVKKQEEIVVVRDFPEVFPDDLYRLPPIQEIEFWIELIPRATPVAKSPYRLAPSELEDMSGHDVIQSKYKNISR